MLWHCDDCTTPYSVGAPACPNCGSNSYHEQSRPLLVDRGGTPLCPHCRKDFEMAKATVHGGPTNANDTPTPAPDPEVDPEPEPEPEPDGEAGGNTVVIWRPALNASREEWEAYVLTLDPAADTGGRTRAQLIVDADELEPPDESGG